MDFDSLQLYVPEYCVQGERIPFYLLWDNSRKIKVTINLPKGLTLEEIYNVDDVGLKFENDAYVIDDFEVEGYLGGILGSKLYDTASIVKTIKFVIDYNSKETQTHDKSIELFRPDVHVNDEIETITVRSDKNNRPIVDGKITIFNRGKGTAIVRINILNDSEIKEGQPEGFEEFRIKFMNDLNEAFTEIGNKFPQYHELIESVREASKNPLPSEDEKLKKIQATVNELEKVFNDNEEFLSEFVQKVTEAYLRNVSLMTDVDAFLAFLNSVGQNKLIILDAMKILKVSPNSRKLSAEILMTDLAQNNYPPIKLRPIAIKTDKDFSLPVYQILRSLKVD